MTKPPKRSTRDKKKDKEKSDFKLRREAREAQQEKTKELWDEVEMAQTPLAFNKRYLVYLEHLAKVTGYISRGRGCIMRNLQKTIESLLVADQLVKQVAKEGKSGQDQD